MLELKNIQTFYGNIQALKGVSLKINQEVITLIGANGAGKSTTLLSIFQVGSAQGGRNLF